MKPFHYVFGIFFLVLSILCSLVNSVVYFKVEHSMYFLQNFAHWFLVANIISVIAMLFVLHYLFLQGYKVAFWTGTAATVVLICHVVFTYVAMILVLRELEGVRLILLIPLFISSTLFAATLVFSRAAEKRWMKIAGVIMLVLYLVLSVAFVWGLTSADFFATDTFFQIELSVSIFGNLVPVCFVMCFRSELASFSDSDVQAMRQSPFETFFGAVGMIAIVAALLLGVQVGRESYWNATWQKHGAEKNIELAKRFEKRYYVSGDGDTLHYLLKRPAGYDQQNEYPLVVCLHGGPLRIPQLEVAQPAPFLTEPENERKYQAFIFVPQGPPHHAWGGLPHLPSVDSLVFEAIFALEEEVRIDTHRRYVVGGSMGGYGVWHFIGTRPDMFAAAIPFCGAGDTVRADRMAEVPVWAFHGAVDRNVPVRGSRDMIEAIKRAGGNPRYTEFPDVGHNVWPVISNTEGVMDWMFSQRKPERLD